mmetsp:Transcript_33307/g.54028  ORF Transcript_33307/g.54028 Transcript_33307/m.54028 type:complete len:465 (-) Transcript_33307:1289-2683(-)
MSRLTTVRVSRISTALRGNSEFKLRPGGTFPTISGTTMQNGAIVIFSFREPNGFGPGPRFEAASALALANSSSSRRDRRTLRSSSIMPRTSTFPPSPYGIHVNAGSKHSNSFATLRAHIALSTASRGPTSMLMSIWLAVLVSLTWTSIFKKPVISPLSPLLISSAFSNMDLRLEINRFARCSLALSCPSPVPTTLSIRPTLCRTLSINDREEEGSASEGGPTVRTMRGGPAAVVSNTLIESAFIQMPTDGSASGPKRLISIPMFSRVTTAREERFEYRLGPWRVSKGISSVDRRFWLVRPLRGSGEARDLWEGDHGGGDRCEGDPWEGDPWEDDSAHEGCTVGESAGMENKSTRSSVRCRVMSTISGGRLSSNTASIASWRADAGVDDVVKCISEDSLAKRSADLIEDSHICRQSNTSLNCCSSSSCCSLCFSVAVSFCFLNFFATDNLCRLLSTMYSCRSSFL